MFCTASQIIHGRSNHMLCVSSQITCQITSRFVNHLRKHLKSHNIFCASSQINMSDHFPCFVHHLRFQVRSLHMCCTSSQAAHFKSDINQYRSHKMVLWIQINVASKLPTPVSYELGWYFTNLAGTSRQQVIHTSPGASHNSSSGSLQF